VKCSGVGREYGLYGMEAFLETRAIHINPKEISYDQARRRLSH
jgi:hypothetical protein